jgi:hypothetical protein
MSTPTTEPIVVTNTTNAPVPTPPAAQPAAPADPAPAQETDWKAMARKWEANAKENSEAAKKLAAIEEANKTEAEKLADRATKAEARAAEAERKAFAATKGIPASLIHGTTEAEWEAAATEALTWRGEAPKPPAAPSANGQGKVGDPIGAVGSQLTAADLELMSPTQVNEARRAGRLKTLLG